MPEDKEKNVVVEIPENARLSLERAFHIFQEQSDMLEKSHFELQQKLNEAQLNLEAKNKELAQRIAEIENIKEKQEGILESITDAVFLANSQNEINPENKAAEKLAEELASKDKKLLDIPEIAKLSSTEITINENINVNIAGRSRNYMVTVVPMSRTGNSECGEKLITMKDVSEYLELQERVKREDRMSALGKVAASVAHEIRNPLGAIEGFAVLLERDLKDAPNSQRLATKTIYAARQLNSVVGNLLSYTREIKPDKSMNYVDMLINQALDFVMPMAEDNQVELIRTESPQPLTAMLDPVQIKQVITNIAINAVEACPRRNGGKVEIKTSKKAESAIIEIIDNGEGVPDDVKARIFEPFFTQKDGGIGLGLSLCQRIVESHEGKIFECGNFGKGAHFIIELKLAEV
jgi:signal transduction histidine kinase